MYYVSLPPVSLPFAQGRLVTSLPILTAGSDTVLLVNINNLFPRSDNHDHGGRGGANGVFFIKKNHMGIYCVEVTIIAAVMRGSKLEVDDIN